MFGISSELASQTISKNMVWDCLIESGKVSGSLTSDILKRMTVEGWAVGVRVVIQRAHKGIESIKGLLSFCFLSEFHYSPNNLPACSSSNLLGYSRFLQ